MGARGPLPGDDPGSASRLTPESHREYSLPHDLAEICRQELADIARAFGLRQLLSCSGVALPRSFSPLLWTGRELDETGLYYLRGRYYTPNCGRFLSEDPVGD